MATQRESASFLEMEERNIFGQMDLDGLLTLGTDEDGEGYQATGSNVPSVQHKGSRS